METANHDELINSSQNVALGAHGAFKCHLCFSCNGKGCVGQLPGMGGVDENYNFIANCSGWKKAFDAMCEEERGRVEGTPIDRGRILCAPVTGAVQNIGFENEADFYPLYLKKALAKGYGVCIGDGEPDEKLKLGLDAARALRCAPYVFCKPYPQEKLLARAQWALDIAQVIGVDIDAYNIKTMRRACCLEQKSARQLQELRASTKKPLAVKGVFTLSDIELCRELLPDIIVVSNHGGRVDQRHGSTAQFLKEYAKALSGYCKQLWVDGGLRSDKDVRTAFALGAARVLIGRPLIQEVIRAL